jgi:hypothetical protein
VLRALRTMPVLEGGPAPAQGSLGLRIMPVLEGLWIMPTGSCLSLNAGEGAAAGHGGALEAAGGGAMREVSRNESMAFLVRAWKPGAERGSKPGFSKHPGRCLSSMAVLDGAIDGAPALPCPRRRFRSSLSSKAVLEGALYAHGRLQSPRGKLPQPRRRLRPQVLAGNAPSGRSKLGPAS